MRLKLIAAVILTAVLGVALPAAPSGDRPKTHIFSLIEDEFQRPPSHFSYSETSRVGGNIFMCPELVAPCLKSTYKRGVENFTSTNRQSVSAQLVMGVCESRGQNFCIESVRIYKAGEEGTDAVLSRQLPGGAKAYPDVGIPKSGGTSLWRSSSLDPDLADVEVAAYVKANFSYSGSGTQMNGLTVQLLPYLEEAGRFAPGVLEPQTDPVSAKDKWTWSLYQGCVWTTEDACGRPAVLPEDVRLGITIRIPTGSTQFYQGRLADSEISTKSLSKRITRVTVDAFPVNVNSLEKSFPRNSKVVRDIDSQWRQSNAFHTVMWTVPATDYDQAAKVIDFVGAALKDKATSSAQLWRFASVDVSGRCWNRPNQFLGLVASNSMAYEPGPPTFKNGYLDYKVSGLHFNSAGEVERGSYDLILRSDVAQCIYGLSGPASYAGVTITGADSDVATTTFSNSKGWAKLHVKNFTYSKKTIRVKLTQKR